MNAALKPGHVLLVDESMGLWKGRGMPGLMTVPRMPTHVGREYHTTACATTGAIIHAEIYEGKALMANKDFVIEVGKGPAVALRCTRPWHGSGRCVIVDSAFASMKCVKGFAERGMFIIGNVKQGHSDYPKEYLLSLVKQRGQRASCVTTITTDSGETWEVLAAAGMDATYGPHRHCG